MLEDLLKQIGEVIEGEGSNQNKRDPRVNIVVGNDSTVVVGDGNHDIGRRESDRPVGECDETRCHGRRESDHVIRDELNQLRRQVKDLVQLVTRLFLKDGSEDLKDDLPDSSACLNSNDRTPSKRPDVSFSTRMASVPLVKSKRRATPRPVPDRPIQSRFIPDVSYLMSSHNG